MCISFNAYRNTLVLSSTINVRLTETLKLTKQTYLWEVQHKPWIWMCSGIWSITEEGETCAELQWYRSWWNPFYAPTGAKLWCYIDSDQIWCLPLWAAAPVDIPPPQTFRIVLSLMPIVLDPTQLHLVLAFLCEFFFILLRLVAFFTQKLTSKVAEETLW